MKCPVCGDEKFREGRMCPEQSGDVICIDCCRQCVFYSSGSVPCRYYIANPEKTPRNYAAEIYKINRQIEEKKKAKSFAENKGRWYYAEQLRGEIGHLVNDRNYLVEERNKYEKQL